MIEIDGSQKSGSGTILRTSLALAAVIGESLHISNIRQNRPQPGLKPQHLEAVLTACKLCDAQMEGAKLGSRELWFRPQKVRSGKIEAEIGTAGSISMLLMTVLPICAFAEQVVQLHVTKGGTDVQHSPTVNYMRFVFLPVLQRMGLNVSLTVHKYGYYPKGMGEATLTVEPCKKPKPIVLDSSGKIESIHGVSVCTFLSDRKVADRQAEAARNFLSKRKLETNIQIVDDRSNPLQKGSSIVLWTHTNTDAIVGADAIGELRKPSEAVGKEAAEKLDKEITSQAAVDVHLADMLIPYVALVSERSAYTVREVTEHLETNIWLAEKMLNVRFNVERIGGLYRIERLP